LSPGVQASWASDSDFSLGGRVVVGLHGLVKGLESSGIFDYYFPGEGAAANVADWEASANLAYRVEIEGRTLIPYGGAGVGFARYTATVRALETDLEGSETRTGLNLLGGLLFELGRSTPFMEARVTLGGIDQFALSAGVRF
jgi:opacity protein-like surface antigen